MGQSHMSAQLRFPLTFNAIPSSANIFEDGTSSQVSAWQSPTLLPISCKSVQPVPVRVEETVSLVRQSSSGGVTYSPPLLVVGCQNWHPFASAHSAAGGEPEQQNLDHTPWVTKRDLSA